MMKSSYQVQSSKAAEPMLARTVILLLALCSGLSVANIYYAQPLLDSIARDFVIAPSAIGVVVTVTQVFYAAGLLLLVPMGDLFNRRKLIAVQMLLSAGALLTVAVSHSTAVLYAGIAIVGLLAVAAQTMVAAAAAFSAPSERGRTVGLVTSGIVIGILLARTIAGTLNDWLGWRSVYAFSAVLTLLGSIALYLLLPKQESKQVGLSYVRIVLSVFQLYRELPILRIRALLAMLIFAAFSILWTAMVLPLSSAPLSLSHTAIGAFGLAGVAGALAASFSGRLADLGYARMVSGISLAILLISWVPIGLVYRSIWYLVAGVILLDLAVQAVHVTNQSLIYKARPEAQSRLTAAYMIFYSIGSAAGSIASTWTYAWAGWAGVCWLGAAASGLALLLWAYDFFENENNR
ncbi:MFS transporter [Paenibacillus pinisoli]|uniref:MFS transporter n=1 Tax=Paenibacillus pinisoli TaxID=1276110 RepID=A0A3A6PKU2_9BACL|nr:MFS transporter [Paenibacillus pinisoli]RJX40990.1 MFS transporter [Paenibacillus pinisoli]